MTIKEAFWDQEGNEVRARVLRPESDIALGLRTPDGTYPYDESMVVRNPDTIEVLRETISGGKTREERFTLQGQAINDAGLIRNADTNLVSHIVWEASKPQ